MRRPRHRNSEDHNGRWDDELLIAGVVMALAAVPVTLVILVVAFGALVAAGIPLLLALVNALNERGRQCGGST